MNDAGNCLETIRYVSISMINLFGPISFSKA